MGKPAILDIKTLIMAGIDPKTGLPYKVSGGEPSQLKSNVKKFLRLVDEQDAVNRYVWYNIPCNVTSQEIERLLYYKGQVCFFYDKNLDQFFFMPYALDGTIDYYGRFNTIHPVPMTSGTEEANVGKKKDPLAAYLSKLKLNCVYGIVDPMDLDVKTMTDSAVLLHDYSKQLSQTIIPRVTINDPLLETMAECVPFMRTSLLLSTGVKGIRVNDADQQQSVLDGNRSIERGAMEGQPFIPIVGTLDFQELTDGATAKGEEYMLAMQSLDNLRLSGYGLDNGGLFEKKAHELQSEADINGGPVGLVMQDGLSIRQNFCNIVNSIWGIGIWCEPAQNVMGADIDGDGLEYDRDEDGASTGVESEQGGAEDAE